MAIEDKVVKEEEADMHGLEVGTSLL